MAVFKGGREGSIAANDGNVTIFRIDAAVAAGRIYAPPVDEERELDVKAVFAAFGDDRSVVDYDAVVGIDARITFADGIDAAAVRNKPFIGLNAVCIADRLDLTVVERQGVVGVYSDISGSTEATAVYDESVVGEEPAFAAFGSDCGAVYDDFSIADSPPPGIDAVFVISDGIDDDMVDDQALFDVYAVVPSDGDKLACSGRLAVDDKIFLGIDGVAILVDDRQGCAVGNDDVRIFVEEFETSGDGCVVGHGIPRLLPCITQCGGIRTRRDDDVVKTLALHAVGVDIGQGRRRAGTQRRTGNGGNLRVVQFAGIHFDAVG